MRTFSTYVFGLSAFVSLSITACGDEEKPVDTAETDIDTADTNNPVDTGETADTTEDTGDTSDTAVVDTGDTDDNDSGDTSDTSIVDTGDTDTDVVDTGTTTGKFWTKRCPRLLTC